MSSCLSAKGLRLYRDVKESCKRTQPELEVVRIFSLLLAVFQVVELGKLHYRQLEAAKSPPLQEMNGNFDSKIFIIKVIKTDQYW